MSSAEYKWGQAPQHLKTRSQLAADGLRPPTKAKPVAQIWWGRGRRQRFADLFDAREAVPKKKETEAQAVARAKALEVRRIKQSTCPGCKKLFPYELSRAWLRGDIDECPNCSRIEASATAQRVLSSSPLVYVDFETTDIGGFAVELGILGSDGQVLLEQRFNPRVPIEPGATRVHGIRDEDVRDCPTFADAIGRIAPLLHGAVAVAYNSAFDAGVLRRELLRMESDVPCKPQWKCAMAIFDVYRGRERSVPLPAGTHSAVGDCLAVRELMLMMARKTDADGQE